MESAIIVVFAALAVFVAWRFVAGLRAGAATAKLNDASRVERGRGLAAQGADAKRTAAGESTAKNEKSLDQSVSARLHRAAKGLEGFAASTASPSALAAHADFSAAVEVLLDEAVPLADLVEYARGGNWVVSCTALEALERRADATWVSKIAEGLGDNQPWASWFALRAIDQLAGDEGKTIAAVISGLDDSFAWNRHKQRFLEEFLALRSSRGEPLEVTDFKIEDPTREEEVEAVLRRLPAKLSMPLRESFDRWRDSRFDLAVLRDIGSIRRIDDAALPIGHPMHDARCDQVLATLLTRRSVVLVGESGVGKTAVVDSVTRRLTDDGWVVFEAGHTELIAGQVYVGQLEQRLQVLLRQLGGSKIVWYIPDLPALRFTGRHSQSENDALSMLLPHIERQRIVVLTEALPAPWSRLREARPRVRQAFERSEIQPMSDGETLALAREVARRRLADSDIRAPGDDFLSEAAELARQFLADRAAPGSLLRFLGTTFDRISARGGERQGQAAAVSRPERQLTTDDLIETLAQHTGLPARILDDRQTLEMSTLRERFENSVLGQPEAIDCLVERVAMIKAGVCDPTRPLGVFLFAGPTGTGKTEVAKTLSRYLFGSDQRLVRLDMSEFQHSESLDRILGDGTTSELGGSLCDQVRKQPFSIVLLDEFEKAAPQVWDLFLQVFDDGRLTDHRGVLTDFRNTLIILTSNLGAAVPVGHSIGFAGDGSAFHAASVERELARVFRPEFRNRIDRTVIFRPLSRDVMRRLLEFELRDVFERRGLRRRQWAVEWDSSAIEFLLDQGFTPDLGARPLKRAVEEHLLAPLARSIVDAQVPEGDQFLFIRAAGDRLAVEFVDPDASSPSEVEAREQAERSGGAPPVLTQMALSPRGDEVERAELTRRVAQLAETLDSPRWQERKQDAMSQMARSDFWSRDDRFDVLTLVESIDRLRAATRTVESLGQRLAQHQGDPPSNLVGRLAQKVRLIEVGLRDLDAGVPWDAYLAVEVPPDAGAETRSWAGDLVSMYSAWAERRSMRSEVVDRGPRTVLSIVGFGAWSLLESENGVHVLEVPTEGRGTKRVRARVRVAAQPAANGLGTPATAVELLERKGDEVGIARRYRREPSPLVRDASRGWKTGHLERVLAGDFDLFGDDTPSAVDLPA